MPIALETRGARASECYADSTRVQHIADSSDLEGSLNLTALGGAIDHLIGTSTSLDEKTKTQLDELHKLLPPPSHRKDHACDCPAGFKASLKQTLLRACAAFGSDRCAHKLRKSKHHDHGHGGGGGGPPHLPKKKVEAIKKVLAELRAGNKKRQGFEGGFISEEGIKVSGDPRPAGVGSSIRCGRWLMVNRRGSGTSTRALLRAFG